MSVSDIDLPIVSRIEKVRGESVCLVSPCPDAAQIRSVICGQSHNVALARALAEPLADGTPSRAMAMAASIGLAALLRPRDDAAYPILVERISRTRNAVLMWTGNQANADFLMMPGQPIDLIPRNYGDTSVLRDAQLVAELAIRAHFATRIGHLDQMLSALGRPDGLRRIVLGVPPPLLEEAVMRRHMRKPSGFFPTKAAQMRIDAETVRFAPASVRRKLWFVLMEMFRDMAERHGALFLPCPAGALDADGYLKPELTAEDGTHGNVAYGRMMIEQLVPLLARTV